MRYKLLPLISLLLVGCVGRAAPDQAAAPPPPAPADAQKTNSTTNVQPDPELKISAAQKGELSRDQVRAVILRELEDPRVPIRLNLQRLVREPRGPEDLPWLEADLDGDGVTEYVVGFPVAEPAPAPRPGAALFVIRKAGGQWAVDSSPRMVGGKKGDRADLMLMAPRLHGVADLTGVGQPQIIWSRPQMIATGPQPSFVYITQWKPGAFIHLPGTIAISSMRLTIDGAELVLDGMSRRNWSLPVRERIDRYRYVDGAMRLVDRWFSEHPDDGYACLWDGLVAEESGRQNDAEMAYRQAADPSRVSHSGKIIQYNTYPIVLAEEQMEQFGSALRTFAQFRLGGLLVAAGRREEALAVLQPDGGPYDDLLAAMREAPDRAAGCRAAGAWATESPPFLKALNLGVGTAPWTPDILCSHVDLAERIWWEL